MNGLGELDVAVRTIVVKNATIGILVSILIGLAVLEVFLLNNYEPPQTPQPIPTVTSVTSITVTPPPETVTVTKTVTKTANSTLSTRTNRAGINTYNMDITWGCAPGGCHAGTTDLNTCHVWIHAPSWALQSILDHEYIHVLQCKNHWWYGRSDSEIERVADAGALLLGATYVYYTNTPTEWENTQARALLGLE